MTSVREKLPSRSKSPDAFKTWCQKELSRLLKFSVEDELVSYLLSIQSSKDAEEYLRELLGSDTPPCRKFQQDFLRHWCPPERLPPPPSASEKELFQKLVRPETDDMVLFSQLGKTGSKRGGGGGGGGAEKGPVPKPPGLSAQHGINYEELKSARDEELKSARDEELIYKPPPGFGEKTLGSSLHLQGKRSRQKFIPLMSTEGQSHMTTHIPGRHSCQCLAQKHALVNNCVECGRIVCAQEGSGPCLFCGALVCTSEEEELFSRQSKKAQKQKEKLLRQFHIKEGDRVLEQLHRAESSEGLTKALCHKDKLLEFDQTSIRRTKVFDDEHDYYAVDSDRWLSEKERAIKKKREEELREKRHGSRRNKAITLDFAGRRVVDEDSPNDMYSEQCAQDLHSNGTAGQVPVTTHAGGIYNPHIRVDPPRYLERQDGQKTRKRGHTEDGGGDVSSPIVRVQDRGLQEMRDEGKCLSMHQPWASLLVLGIKRVEGRTWYTTHRGRLWIAAAAKEPTADEIKSVEDFYTTLYGDKQVYFPSEYPVSCLLGSVDVVDCLPQEDYREKYPGGESESPYVFVCENPQELTVKFPITGQHKIWKLPPDTHTSAKRGCKPSQP